MLNVLAITGWLLYPAIALFILVSFILVVIVLIQKGRGGGLIGAFGGAGGNTAFGAKTGDVLTWATSIIFGVFLLLAIVLNLMTGTSDTRVSPGTSGGTPTNSTPVTPPAAPAK